MFIAYYILLLLDMHFILAVPLPTLPLLLFPLHRGYFWCYLTILSHSYLQGVATHAIPKERPTFLYLDSLDTDYYRLTYTLPRYVSTLNR